MKFDFTSDPVSLQKLTGFQSFTKERLCKECNSPKCPGKELIQFGREDENEFVDGYPCFIKARLLVDLPLGKAKKLLLANRLLR